MEVYEVILDDENQNSGINAISLVKSPAIESNFIALSKEDQPLKLANEERRIVMGAALIPNKPIYRRAGEEEFYIMFSKETIRKASELYFQRDNLHNATVEHEQSVKGLTTVESWIVEDVEHDKTKMYDLKVPLGTWMVSMKVNNPDVWEEVKLGNVKGFSIEGYFMPEYRQNLKAEEPKKDIDNYDEKLNIVKELLGL